MSSTSWRAVLPFLSLWMAAMPRAAGGEPAEAEHWSFRRVAAPRPPRVRRRDWPRTPVDLFILERLEATGLSPAPPADPRTLLRRATLDLTGLPPAPAEVEAFLSDDSPDAFERAVDRLLTSPGYGERWGRHWLDLVRFAETAGNEFDYEIPYAWSYRDYVIRALNDDVPYDRFVVEHIAGDLLPEPRRHPTEGFDESTIGTGFFWLGQAMQSPIDVLEEEHETIENQIDVLGKTFLGLSVACARCHDHKFDPLSMRDYYSLVGYLQSSRRQFAFVDPPAETADAIRRIEALDASHRDLAREHEGRDIEARIDGFARRLIAAGTKSSAASSGSSAPAGDSTPGSEPLTRYLEDVARQDPLDILYPWTVLAGAEKGDDFTRRREGLLRDMRERAAVAGRAASGAPVRVFEDFDGDTYGECRASGPAFGDGPGGAGELVIGGDTGGAGQAGQTVARLVPAGFAHSGRVSGKLRGVLRSPTFPIETKYIHYRAYRSPGPVPVAKIDPGDIKEGQIHLIVDGFHMIRQPIYHGLSIDLRAGGGPGWYRQDVGKWIGHRAYIEVADEDDGFIAVDRIVFSDDRDSPPASGNGLLRRILEDDEVSSPDVLALAYEELFAESVRLWMSGTVAESPERADRLEIIDWLLEHGATLLGPGDPAVTGTAVRGVLARYLEARRSLESRLVAPRRVLAMQDGTAEDACLLVRGDHARPSDPVSRRFLEALGGGGVPSPEGSGRLDLARRIAGASNPLVARVIVNRVWHHLFGRGIVPTPDDFGALGKPPTHPELLDFLAVELIESGWSLKHIQRLLVTSSTYRMSSRADAEAGAVDPDNRLLHRMRVRRLQGETIRDAVLAVSGRLDRRMYGPGVLPHLTPFMEGRGRPDESGPLDGDGRRSVYINVRRNFLSPFFLVFDYPVPQSTMGRRSVSNVPAQALTMWNNPFVLQQARLWADRVLREGDLDGASRIRRLYEVAFARPPSATELEEALRFIARHGSEHGGPDDPRVWTDLCHVLLNVREFIFIR